MATTAYSIRPQLLERRARLQAAAASVSPGYLNNLIAEVDAALKKIDAGKYGLCETCNDSIEKDRLERNPLCRFCLDHLNDTERAHHQKDLDLATQIQFQLLPPRGLVLGNWETQHRYEPLGAVGGDYCEVIPLGDPSRGAQSLFFAVGDVAGKGVAASLLMMHLSAIFRSLLSMHL
jgi:phosphoserine phosphatase RsbU/P